MFASLVNDNIATLPAYVPGKPIEELEREYGIAGAVKIASNENPLGPSPLALRAIQEHLSQLHRYPESGAFALRERLSQHLCLAPDRLIFGNGSDEILDLALRTFVKPGEEVISAAPSFLMYGLITQAVGGRFIPVPLTDFRIDLAALLRAVTSRTKMVIINNPNNPTGTAIHRREWEGFLAALPDRIIVLVDEAYIEFVQADEVPTALDYLRGDRALLGLRTFSKAYGLAGLRIGYGYGPAELIAYLERLRPPFNINRLAQVAARAALDDTPFLQLTRQVVWDGLATICRALEDWGVPYVPTQANFLLINVGRDSREVFEGMLRQGVIIRAMNGYGLPEYIRVNAGRPEENQQFLQAFRKVMGLSA